MKFSLPSVILGLAALSSAAPTTSYFAGFNLGSTRPDGQCKTTADYQIEFAKIKGWSTGGKATYNVIKLFSTNDCDQLSQAIPAAISTGVKLWAGVWNVDDAKFNAEKAALERALIAYPDTSKWLKGINVGSESLYRKEIHPDKLAGQIYDVKGMVQIAYKSPAIPVGTADTWTMWVLLENTSVVKACDVVIMNGFPYWQGATIGDSLTKLRAAVSDTRKTIGYEKPFMIGETGHPSKGPNFGDAVASPENLRAYWKAAACWALTKDYPWLWFSAFDEPNRGSVIEQNFGIAGVDMHRKIKMTC